MPLLLRTTVKQRVRGDDPVPFNDVARRSYVTSRGTEPDGTPVAIWRIPKGALVSLPEEASAELLRLGYAEPLPA